ncbi:M15 family metallopeptidase [Candidatus Dependentiae bacterium]|nr:M15 family metallopeptidase [Candidatus Dependentiae bacterium]
MRKLFLSILSLIVATSYFNTALSTERLFFKLQNKQLIVEKTTENQEVLDLVDIETINPNIILDIRYATTNNILEKVLYRSAKCYFRKHVAYELDKIQKKLEPMGLGLKIFDGYRPWQIQVDGYKKFPNLFAKPTTERAKHPRGTAVDLTLVDTLGNEVLMPTDFDDTTIKASRAHKAGIPKEAIENREVLSQIMVKYGFIPLASEWWHFDHYTWKAYHVITLEFEEIEKTLNKESKYE